MEQYNFSVGNIVCTGKLSGGSDEISILHKIETDEFENWNRGDLDVYTFKTIIPKTKSSGFYSASKEDIFPVILNVEWLRRFGFERKDENFLMWKLNDFEIGWYGNKFASWIITSLKNERTSEIYTDIKFVHELQNLYLLLTGIKLEIVRW